MFKPYTDDDYENNLKLYADIGIDMDSFIINMNLLLPIYKETNLLNIQDKIKFETFYNKLLTYPIFWCESLNEQQYLNFKLFKLGICCHDVWVKHSFDGTVYFSTYGIQVLNDDDLVTLKLIT